MPDDAVTLDYVCEKLITYGTPEQVTERILALREEIGDFGQIVYVGHDWADPALGRRSMVLMAEKVLPALNSSISSSVAAR